MFSRLRAALEERVRRWARRRQGMDRVPLTLEKRRVYILPTGFGYLYALFLLVLLLEAWQTRAGWGLRP